MSLTDGDIQNIRDLSDNFTKHMLQQKFEDLANLYTEDAVVMPPGPTVTGRSEVQKFMEGFPTLSKFEFRIQDIDGHGDLAYVRGSYLMVMMPEGAPEQVEDRGKYVEVRRKQADGSWPIAVDIFNSDG